MYLSSFIQGVYLSSYLQEPVTKRRRQLGRRDSEEAVQRAIDRHFGHLPAEVIETHRIDGLLLRDRIKQDRAHLPSGGRLGAHYWIELAGRMNRGMEGVDKLKPKKEELGHISGV